MTEIIIHGWKGKSGIEINEDDNDKYIVREFRKSKEDDSIKEHTRIVPKEMVNRVLGNLLQNCEQGEIYGYKYHVRKWIELTKIHEKYGLTIEQMIDSFNGGKYRKLVYFPYYYCLKILEVRGIIEYFSRGDIRINDIKKKGRFENAI